MGGSRGAGLPVVIVADLPFDAARIGGDGGGRGAPIADIPVLVPPVSPLTVLEVESATPTLLVPKYSRQIGSTLSGSARNSSYLSCTNQSLGPNSGALDDMVVLRLF